MSESLEKSGKFGRNWIFEYTKKYIWLHEQSSRVLLCMFLRTTKALPKSEISTHQWKRCFQHVLLAFFWWWSPLNWTDWRPIDALFARVYHIKASLGRLETINLWRKSWKLTRSGEYSTTKQHLDIQQKLSLLAPKQESGASKPKAHSWTGPKQSAEGAKSRTCCHGNLHSSPLHHPFPRFLYVSLKKWGLQ